jgi:2-methylcitrate dehydratase PrpD
MEMYGPSMQKRLNPGPAARNGIVSAMLAAGGYTGASTIFEGTYGIGAAFAGGINLDVLLHGLGTEVPVTVEYKPYSAARPLHNGIDAALALAERGISAADVERIEIVRHPDWSEYHRNIRPTTFHEAQVSLPYATAVALVDGAALPPQFADDQLDRPELVRLMSVMSFVTDPELPRGVSLRLTVDLSDGRRESVQVDSPKGSVANPMDDHELRQKFLSLAQPVIADRATNLADTISRIDESVSTAHLMRLLAPEGATDAAA